MTTTHDITQLLGSIAGPLAEIFGDMEIAETAIETACKVAPLSIRPLLFGSFLLLQPQMRMPEMLYKSHCRELLLRVACGGDLNAPTIGEIGTAIYEMTLVSPMRSVIGGLYMKIVQEAAPREFRRAGLDTDFFQFREEWPGQLEETRAEISNHIAKRLQPRTPPVPRSPSGQRRESMAQAGIIFPKEGDMHKLYTIGYSGLNPADFKRWVERENALVIDTRMSAASRIPAFTKSGLTKLLGSQYRHVQALGNINYKSGGEIRIKDPAEGYRIVLGALTSSPVVLLCGCKDVDQCHRKVIADALEQSIGSTTIHLKPNELRPASEEIPHVAPPDDFDADLTQRGLFSSRDDRTVNPARQQPKLL